MQMHKEVTSVFCIRKIRLKSFLTNILKVLTSYQDKCCHVALTAMEVGTHLQQVVKHLTT